MNPEFWRGRRVFLTGHSGFKGTWLATWLRMMGATVTGYALPDDIRDLPALRAAMVDAAPDVVFHLAAQALVRRSYDEPVETFATNVMGTVHLLEALRAAPSVQVAILATSDKCYHNTGRVVAYREDDRLGGSDPYSSSKACAELVIDAYRRSFLSTSGPRLVSVRAGNVIGGGDGATDRLVPDLIRAFRAGEAARIRYPDARRPWQFVLDALHGYLLAAEQACAGADLPDAFNFGPAEAEPATVRWLADRMADRWGGQASWIGSGDDHPHEAATLALDSTLARQNLGWTPLLDADAAIGWTIDWHRSGQDLTVAQIERFMAMASA